MSFLFRCTRFIPLVRHRFSWGHEHTHLPIERALNEVFDFVFQTCGLFDFFCEGSDAGTSPLS
jgi:hypothetical protein